MYTAMLDYRLRSLSHIMAAVRAAMRAPALPGETPEDRNRLILVTLDGGLADLLTADDAATDAHLLALTADAALAAGTMEVSRE